MKKLLTLVVLLLATTAVSLQSVYGQKLVIGSDAPSMKEIEWKTSPPPAGKAMIIEFYQSSNPTSKGFFPKLAPLKGKMSIVVLTRDTGAALDALVSGYADSYYIGHDPTGNTFTSYGVKYLPFSMILDGKSKVMWIGNLGNLQQSVVDKVK